MDKGFRPAQMKWRGTRVFYGGRALPIEVVRDEFYPAMWRVRRPDGTLTDMANVSWAKDAALSIAAKYLNESSPLRASVRSDAPQVSGGLLVPNGPVLGDAAG